jgi:hypothetical protein
MLIAGACAIFSTVVFLLAKIDFIAKARNDTSRRAAIHRNIERLKESETIVESFKKIWLAKHPDRDTPYLGAMGGLDSRGGYVFILRDVRASDVDACCQIIRELMNRIHLDNVTLHVISDTEDGYSHLSILKIDK